MKKPYEHHHGRLSMDAYIAMLPETIRRVALQRRTRDWSFWHFYSIPQAILRLIDKENMGEAELKFWDQVYHHYLGRGDLPSMANVEAFMEKGPVLDDLRIPDHATHTEKVRTVFRHTGESMTCEQVHRALVRSGHSIDLQSVRYIVSSYLFNNGEVRKMKSKPYTRSKLYKWIQ